MASNNTQGGPGHHHHHHDSGGGQGQTQGSGSGIWPLTSLNSHSYTRTAMDLAQELLPNLPRRSNNGAAAGRQSASSLSSAASVMEPLGQVSVDLSSVLGGEESQESESLTISPQVASRMEDIRALLQSMNNQQQQQEHQHTHSHLSPPSNSSPTPPDHTHTHHGHTHGNGNEARDNGNGNGSQLDIRGLVKLLQNSGVFFILLLLRFIYDHSLGLMVMVALGGTFYYINMKLVQCIHQSAVREVGSGRMTSIGYPLWLLSFLGINVCLLYFSFKEQALWNMLRYKMPLVGVVDVWTLLWVVLITDFVVKFSTVAAKCCVFLLPACCLHHRHRGKYYMFVEKLSQFYRLTLPIMPWVHYLLDDQEIGRWFALVTVIVYSIFKSFSLYSSVKEVGTAFKKVRMHRSFGTKPGAEELRQRGVLCSICQEEYKEPILLACKHIFCDNCISLWFDREKTCPMCRAQITDDPQWQDGSTSSSLQWY